MPFDSRRSYSAYLNNFTESYSPFAEKKKKKVIIVLGAPEKLISLSDCVYTGYSESKKLTKEIHDGLQNKISKMASHGLKVLGIAMRPVPDDTNQISEDKIEKLDFLGLVAFSDPVRQDVRESIAVAQGAGIRIIMITGDHVLTAKFVASQVGIINESDDESNRVIEGKNLPADLTDTIIDYDVFARISPNDKLRIIEAFKKQSESVAMIGDGINDVGALVASDLGVAVGSGTDVAKEASDMILLNDSFSIIVEAIKQGRIILDNMKKAIIFLLSSAFSEIILISGSILFNLPLALIPAQILWVNIIVDGLPAISLAFEKDESNIMKREPSPAKSILTNKMIKMIFSFSIITDLVLFSVFYLIFKTSENIEYVRTIIFISLGLTSLLYIFSVKSLDRPIWKIDVLSNKMLLFSVGLGIFLYFIAIYFKPLQGLLETVPLSPKDWLILFGIGLFNISVFEFVKWKYFRSSAIFK
jgi:Ca2+-transporting ATPase